MPITSAWTTPSTLDLAVGGILTEAIWDNLVSNELYLWDTLHNYARAAAILSMTIGTADVNLYRGGADILKTDDAINAGGDIVANIGQTEQVTLRDIGGQAGIYFSNANDTEIQRISAGLLGTSSSWRITRAAATAAYTARISGDTNDHLTIQADGAINWGSGAAALDTSLYRSAANVLKTDDAFVAVGEITAPNLPYRIGRSTPSGTGTLTFSSIPATYRHLQIRGLVRSSAAANSDGLRLQINGLTTAIYSWTHMAATNVATTTTNTNGDTSLFQSNSLPAANWGANVFASVKIDIHEYGNAVWKQVITDLMGTDPGGVVQHSRVISGGTIETTAAISSITLFLTTGNYVAGSSFDLWGIP